MYSSEEQITKEFQGFSSLTKASRRAFGGTIINHSEMPCLPDCSLVFKKLLQEQKENMTPENKKCKMAGSPFRL